MALINPRQTGVDGSPWIDKPVGNLTAAGSTQGTAFAIPVGQSLSIFTTVATSTGAIMPGSSVTPGETYKIANHGLNALSVYPPTGGKMGTASTNAAYSLAAGKLGSFLFVGQLQWTTNP